MFWTVLFITIALVAFFALSMSLTLIFKGHNIKSEVSQNPKLQQAGVVCPIKEATDADCPNELSVSDCSQCLSSSHCKDIH